MIYNEYMIRTMVSDKCLITTSSREVILHKKIVSKNVMFTDIFSSAGTPLVFIVLDLLDIYPETSHSQ